MPQDILLDENLDISIKNGDFEVGESTYQHQQLLLLMEKGELKVFPKNGVASKRYLESYKPDEYAREIRQEFIADGLAVKSIHIAENLDLTIDANY